MTPSQALGIAMIATMALVAFGAIARNDGFWPTLKFFAVIIGTITFGSVALYLIGLPA